MCVCVCLFVWEPAATLDWGEQVATRPTGATRLFLGHHHLGGARHSDQVGLCSPASPSMLPIGEVNRSAAATAALLPGEATHQFLAGMGRGVESTCLPAPPPLTPDTFRALPVWQLRGRRCTTSAVEGCLGVSHSRSTERVHCMPLVLLLLWLPRQGALLPAAATSHREEKKRQGVALAACHGHPVCPPGRLQVHQHHLPAAPWHPQGQGSGGGR